LATVKRITLLLGLGQSAGETNVVTVQGPGR